MKLSVIIPARNEEKNISETILALHNCLAPALKEENIFEIIVVNDNSTDRTQQVLEDLKKNNSSIPLSLYTSIPPCIGFGFAIRKGFEVMTGDCAAIFMADLSDSPEDLLNFFHTMERKNYDCVFGSRFIKGGSVKNYPFVKLLLNRLVNNLVCLLFGIKYNDCTNAFKLYKRETIEGVKPFLSEHFNITLELPLKAIMRGYSCAVLPNSWNGRKTGDSAFRVKEMGSRYFFILWKCLLEKYFRKVKR